MKFQEQRARNAIVYNLPFSNVDVSSAPPIMLSFIRRLKQSYESVLKHVPPDDEARFLELRRNLQSVSFGEAVLEKGELNRLQKDHPLQIAVLGPTQAGKSSVINWLLERKLAEVSPLAGFTVHPQGFCINLQSDHLDWIDGYFRHYQRCPRDTLPADRYDCFALAETAADVRHSLTGTVLWDTPDFDSVDAEDYREAVLRVAALADVVLLVLSKDKYADLSVWELIGLLEPLSQPTVICLNKIEKASYRTLVGSLQEKWRNARRDPPPPVITVPYLEDMQVDDFAHLRDERAQLLGAVDRAIRGVRREQHAKNAKYFIKAHWQNWLAPVKAEHSLKAEWRTLVDEAVRDSLNLYKRDYLNHPHHYETFQRALAELLTLLEIPGLAGTLLTARKIVTWPVRQLVRLGQAVGGRRRQGASGEAAILHQAAEHLFIRISETILLKRDDDPSRQAWWKEMGGLLRSTRPVLTNRYALAVDQYTQAFQPEIEKTAHSLYDRLREHPAVLNGLRATRVTTDAAALAVALHTGGIGVQDFIIAPAMLSLTTMLAESALGRYMNKAAADLKQKQLEAVEKLFDRTVHAYLIGLSGQMDASRQFNISPEAIESAETQLV
ncbi:GTPase [Methylocaldum sp.]|uniref:GTPase n=1 Tax=Methylocaldum sp. TaxID=1969727 RepID=UPI002D3CACE7|nr:GTPase [Methylocaldum sp.]HYE37337.1 GTPase [Methylocaldum sp.]